MNKKQNLTTKIIMIVFAAIAIISGIYFILDMYVITNGEISYFSKHFLISICLFCIGVIAILLPSINQKKFSGENKGDSMMVLVGFLLIICSFFSIMISYLS